MAQIKLTLKQDEIIQLLEDSDKEALKLMLQKSLNAHLLAKSEGQLSAGVLASVATAAAADEALPHAALRHDRSRCPKETMINAP